MFKQQDNRLIFQWNNEKLWIEPWGENSLRVRGTCLATVNESLEGALLDAPFCTAAISIQDKSASIANGNVIARILPGGQLFFYNQHGEELLGEYWRDSSRPYLTHYSLNFPGRIFKMLPGGKHQLTYRLKAYPGEKLFGMGQYQDGCFDKKGTVLELAQRNSQASVPFVLSNRGYGFLWNNPAVGRATFGNNVTEWVADTTEQLDFWITAADTPSAIVEAYVRATGLPPMMPDYVMGFWQCKLRYRTQQELLAVAREYKRRNIPLSVIVIDFFHWTQQGEWKFDPRYWPDPDAMVAELKSLGIEPMVSIWPTVDNRSENYKEMRENGYLVQTNRGVPVTMTFLGDESFADFTNPETRRYVWDKCKENYFNHGIKLYWLDVAEPEYTVYDFDHFAYHTGTVSQVGNCYPAQYARAFYDGLKESGVENPIHLIRCAWAGSQRYGALVWSGDIGTDFETLRYQFVAGLSMAMAGIPWWTTDIGGFHGGEQSDPAYRELLIRWFQWGTFCPVMRLHGVRLNGPTDIPKDECGSGGPNEVWSYGEEAYQILVDHIILRERMRPYIKHMMQECHENGTPVMRPLFYAFPKDLNTWNIEDQYLFGSDLLVAPVLHAGMRKREVYLPMGSNWVDVHSDACYHGGQWITMEAPLDHIPLLLREGSTAMMK